MPYPLIITHRGDHTNAPENTISAFKKAYDIGADGIELDLRLTSDAKLVVFHDRYLGRTTNGNGLVNHHSQNKVCALDAGSWFATEFREEHLPTLDEVLETLLAEFLTNVEMKVIMDGMRLLAHKTAEIVRRHARLESTLVASFNPISLWELRKIAPEITCGSIWSKRHQFPIRSRIFSPIGQNQLVRPR